MKDTGMKLLQKEGFGIFTYYDKEDGGGYRENSKGEYALMLFPKDEGLITKYKDKEIYTIMGKSLSKSEVEHINVENEDERYGLLSFGVMIKKSGE